MSKIKPVRAWAVLIGGRINPYHLYDDEGAETMRRYCGKSKLVEIIIRPVPKARKTCKKK